MGYEVTQTGGAFTICAPNKIAALAAIRGLAGRHYAWVDDAQLRRAGVLEQAFSVWRWEVTTDPSSGDITAIQFIGQSAGDEDTLFAAIAPYVEAGSFIEMLGEDGDRWRWKFDGRGVKLQKARVVWDEE